MTPAKKKSAGSTQLSPEEMIAAVVQVTTRQGEDPEVGMSWERAAYAIELLRMQLSEEETQALVGSGIPLDVAALRFPEGKVALAAYALGQVPHR